LKTRPAGRTLDGVHILPMLLPMRAKKEVDCDK